jgi:phosphohistidine phosphatase
MELIIIRHAIAEDYEEYALTHSSDELRPLSARGEEKMRKNVRGLKKLVPFVHYIASSPLRRAIQTADILARAYPSARREVLSALSPQGPMAATLAYLQQYESLAPTVALIGHEPDLGELTTWFLSGRPGNWLPFKKGGACSIEFRGKTTAGEAELRWLMTPTQLRKLSRSD